MPTNLARLLDRWPSVRPSLVLGATCVVVGGLVAAATAPLQLEHGSWMAAYLVLAAGMAQIALGIGQALLAPRPPTARMAAVQLAGWNLGGVGVIAATLLGAPILTTIAGGVLVATLLSFMIGVRGRGGQSPSVLWFYRMVLVVLIVSVPVGIAMSWQRHG